MLQIRTTSQFRLIDISIFYCQAIVPNRKPTFLKIIWKITSGHNQMRVERAFPGSQLDPIIPTLQTSPAGYEGSRRVDPPQDRHCLAILTVQQPPLQHNPPKCITFLVRDKALIFLFIFFRSEKNEFTRDGMHMHGMAHSNQTNQTPLCSLCYALMLFKRSSWAF